MSEPLSASRSSVTWRSFTSGVEHFGRLFDVRPEVAEQVVAVLSGQPAQYAVNAPFVSPEALVTVTGSQFVGVQSVAFNGVLAPGFTVSNPAQLTVPVSAVSLGPDGGSRVQRSAGGKTEFVAVEPGLVVPAGDLQERFSRSPGPGGQSVNTTDSAVRITHLPTGLMVAIQDEKSQHKNRAKAMSVLRARLLEAEQERQAAERGEERRSQVGHGERSEKIRTYNFPDDRITDHRIGLTVHNLPGLLEGDLDRVIEPLLEADQARRLEDLGDDVA